MAEPALPAPDPTPCYGEVRWPVAGGRTVADPVFRLTIAGARVHGAAGVVSSGRRVLAESLDHVQPAREGAVRDGAVWLVRDDRPGHRVGSAEHLMHGDPGNYYHWLLNGVGRWGIAGAAGAALLPETGAVFQGGARLSGPAVRLARGQVLEVDRLGWCSSLTASGGAFHPAILRLGRAWAWAGAGAMARSIYVSRRDAGQRVLRNEAEIESVCAARGFVPVTLTGMSLADQVALFGAARRIVAPHGAGLANLLFCRPGAAVLELFMDRYVNFCCRRLAACAGVRYGCVIGPADPGGDEEWVHGMTWTLDPARLASVLDDPAFAPEEET